MKLEHLLVRKTESIALVTVNRPDMLNALNSATFHELKFVFTDFQNDPKISGILVKGAGNKAFVAGADITEIQGLGQADGVMFSRLGQQVFNLIENLGKPVIALINGFALGGGCEFAMACHLRIATPDSKFGQPEVNLGLIPGYGGTQRMPRLIGKGRALQYLLTAELIPADTALQIGLVNYIVEPDKLESFGSKILNTILSKGPIAVKHMLEVVNRGLEETLEEGIRLESDYFGLTCETEDMNEGTQAFLEKRKPDFKGK